MGFASGVPENVACVKGWIPYGLDEISKGAGARARLRQLSSAIQPLAPNFRQLERVFDTYLLSHVMTNTRARQEIVEYLGRCWFDDNSTEAYFPNQGVAQIYAEGVLRALELSIKGRRTAVPIDAWWIVGSQEVRMLTFADVDGQGVTVGRRVTLLILTPRPSAPVEYHGPWILGQTAQAWASDRRDNQVSTLAVRDLR